MVISFANQKGGVAKTTSCYNIGVTLAKKGFKVLLIDLDSQASLTICAGLEPFSVEKTIVDVLKKEGQDIRGCITHLQNNLDLISSRLDLSQLEMELIGRSMRETILARAIKDIKSEYDFVLIDCPPQLSILTTNALSTSDYCIIPVKTDYLAYRGVELLLNSIEGIKELINPNLEVFGIIATMYEKRIKDDNEILDVLENNYRVIGVVKRLAVAKKGVPDGISAGEQPKNNEIALEYEKISDLIIKETK